MPTTHAYQGILCFLEQRNYVGEAHTVFTIRLVVAKLDISILHAHLIAMANVATWIVVVRYSRDWWLIATTVSLQPNSWNGRGVKQAFKGYRIP